MPRRRGDVKLSLAPEDWYTLVDDSATKDLAVDSGQVGGDRSSPLEAKAHRQIQARP